MRINAFLDVEPALLPDVHLKMDVVVMPVPDIFVPYSLAVTVYSKVDPISRPIFIKCKLPKYA
jgi:hypothetical protein